MNDIIEGFKEISNLLKNRELPVTSYFLSKKFKISIQSAKKLLSDFISQGNNLNDYIVLFSAEIVKDTGIHTMLIPSYSPKLAEVLSDSKKLFSLSTYAVCKKTPDFLLKDFSIFCREFDTVKKEKEHNITRKATSTHEKLTNNFKEVVKVTAESNNSDDDTELFYGGLNPVTNTQPEVKDKNTNEDNSNTTKQVSKKTSEVIPHKRKAMNDPIPTEAIRKKKEVQHSIVSNIIEVDEKNDKVEVINNRIENVKEEQPLTQGGETKKVKKTRKVKKTNTYVDEKGYLVTKDEWEDEEYWTDEKSKPIMIPASNTVNPPGPGKKTGGKKVAQGQSSIHSFFAK